MAQRDGESWPPLIVANVWTRHGAWWVLHFGFGLLLRAATGTEQDDYLGFWGWFLLVSVAGFGYGVWRYRQETSGPISRTEHWLAWLVVVSSWLIVLFTDNGGARMPGRYAVALLVAAFIVVDSAARRRRGAPSRQVRQVAGVGAEGLEPPTPSL